FLPSFTINALFNSLAFLVLLIKPKPHNWLTPHYYSADHPNPHSFPTRRSSDLHPAGQPAEPCHRPVYVHPLQGADPERPPVGGEDRKSTRLNSSHVSISYAVFCLKKKKKIIIKIGKRLKQ